MKIKPGGIRMGLEVPQRYVDYPVQGLVATDGIRYSAAVSIGTTLVDVLNFLVDPGYSMQLKKLQVGLTQRFDNQVTTSVGSLTYYWEAREEWFDPAGVTGTLRTGAYINITGTYTKGVPTSGVAGDPVEDTFGGYVPLGSLPHAPVRLRLRAVGLVASSFNGDIKNSSFIELVGNVLPGM